MARCSNAFASVRLGSTNSLMNFSMSLSSKVLQQCRSVPRKSSQAETMPAWYHQSWSGNSQPHLLIFFKELFFYLKRKDWKKRTNTFMTLPHFIHCYFFKYLQATLSLPLASEYFCLHFSVYFSMFLQLHFIFPFRVPLISHPCYKNACNTID